MQSRAVVGALLLFAGSAAVAAGDPARGKDYFEICQGCHGADAAGNKAQGAPRLAGQHGWYLVRQLKNFQAGLRGAATGDDYGALMSNFARTLPDEQAIEDVVSYILTLGE